MIIILPPLSNPRAIIAAELVVVAVTFPLITMSPFTVPMQVLVEVALTVPLIVSPVSAEIPTNPEGTVTLPEIVTEPASAYIP